MSRWWNNLFASPYALRVESSAVSLWRSSTLLQSQTMPGVRDTADYYAQLGVAISGLLARASVSRAKLVNIYLGQGLVQHSVITLDARRLSGGDVATAVQGFWGDANSGANTQSQVAWQVQRDGQSIFSSCCDAQLVSNLLTILESSGWQAASVTTHAAQVWNHHRKQVSSDQQCVLILQDDILSMGLQRKGIWQAWSSESCFDTDWSALSNRVARFLRSTGLCDADTTPKCVYAPQVNSSPISAGLHNWIALADKLSSTRPVSP